MEKRIWDLISHALPRGPSGALTTSDLYKSLRAKGFLRSRKMLTRHLETLRLAGQVGCMTRAGASNSPTAARLWYWAAVADRPVREDDLIAQLQDQGALPDTLEQIASRAINFRKTWELERAGDPLVAYWRKLDLGSTESCLGRPPDGVWRPLIQALYDSRIVSARLGGSHADLRLPLEPRYLRATQGGWILVASVVGRGPNGVALNLNEVVSVTACEDRVRDEGLGLPAYRKIARDVSPVAVTETEISARATAKGLSVLGSLAPGGCTKMSESGRLAEVRFAAVPSRWVLDTLWLHAGDIEVTGPEAVRAELRDRASRAKDVYLP